MSDALPRLFVHYDFEINLQHIIPYINNKSFRALTLAINGDNICGDFYIDAEI